IFLFDEPLSNLDAALRVQTRVEITRLHRRLGTTMVYVTHDQVEAMTLADKIVILNDGQVVQVGAPLEVYDHPVDRFAAAFLGSPPMNFLPATLVEASSDHARVTLAGAQGAGVEAQVDARQGRPGDQVAIGIRPEHLRLSHAGPIAARIVAVEHLGDESLVYLDYGKGHDPLVAKQQRSTELRPGDTRACLLAAEACHLFDQGGRAFARKQSPDGSRGTEGGMGAICTT
ncbi:unnamed protein product, partial [marine sediment metagenome]